MIRVKFLGSIFIGAFAYTVISFLAGQNGIWSYNQLSRQKIEIVRQTNYIEKINGELNLEYTALLKDRDVIAAYARKLDYVASGEKLVKIKGLKPYQTILYDIGSPLKRTECVCFSEEFCKICGVVFFLLSFLIMILLDFTRGKRELTVKKEEDSTSQEIPVYDLQQA